jgi:aspartate/glutamate racemase
VQRAILNSGQSLPPCKFSTNNRYYSSSSQNLGRKDIEKEALKMKIIGLIGGMSWESLHRIIFDELTLGKIHESSREKLIALIEKLREQGAGAIILGCTELTLLISQKDTGIPLFDTTALHAQAAVDLACSK